MESVRSAGTGMVTETGSAGGVTGSAAHDAKTVTARSAGGGIGTEAVRGRWN